MSEFQLIIKVVSSSSKSAAILLKLIVSPGSIDVGAASISTKVGAVFAITFTVIF